VFKIKVELHKPFFFYSHVYKACGNIVLKVLEIIILRGFKLNFYYLDMCYSVHSL
jgi:hypothetical protein